MKNPLKRLMIKGYSIQYIIAISTIFVALFPMIYTGISIFEKYSDQIIENSKVSTGQIMEQLKINIDDYLARSISSHNDIEGLLVKNENIINPVLQTNLNMYFSSRNDIVSISLFDAEGNPISVVPNLILREDLSITKESWFKKVLDGSILYYISKPHVQNVIKGQYKWVISICKSVNLVGSDTEQNAILIVDVSLQPLVELCNNLNLGGSGYVYIVDERGEIIYHPQQAAVFSGLKEEMPFEFNEEGEIHVNNQGDGVLIVSSNISFVNWNLVGVSCVKNIEDKNFRIVKEFMVTIPIILMIVILISWYISYRISLPIKVLGRHMEIVQKGNFDIQLDLKNSETEVRRLSETFNAMVKRIKEVIEENKKEQDAKRKSELNALQAQINPHFLYNTLDSIMWMAEAGRNEEVVKMVTSLATLFRISISRGHNIITVREELEHAKNYLLIQKIRYKERFDFFFYAEEEVMDLRTIKLILQPIIENAIYHGIEYMVDLGRIDIYAEIREEKLVFRVEDNGLGMNQETLESICKGFTKDVANKNGNGVGVKNVDQRIKIRYGNEYGIEIESEEEVGTLVRIWMPLIRGEEI